jgi:predicted RNA-binding protein YlqC (UPF0109 family)
MDAMKQLRKILNILAVEKHKFKVREVDRGDSEAIYLEVQTVPSNRSIFIGERGKVANSIRRIMQIAMKTQCNQRVYIHFSNDKM